MIYKVDVAITYTCYFTVDADSREDAIYEVEQMASDSRNIYLQCSDNEVEILEIEESEEES